MANDDNEGRDIIAVFGAMILGALMGGIFALLFAPKSGEELRGDIGDAATRAKKRAEEARDQMAKKYEDLKTRMDRHMEEHAEEAAEATEELAEEIESHIEEA